MNILITKVNRIKLASVSINLEKLHNMKHVIEKAGHTCMIAASEEELDSFIPKADLIIIFNNVGCKKPDRVLIKINAVKKQRGQNPIVAFAIDDADLFNTNIKFDDGREFLENLDFMLVNNTLKEIPEDFLLKELITVPALREGYVRKFDIEPCYFGSYIVEKNCKPESKEEIIQMAVPFEERIPRLIYVGKLNSRAKMVNDLNLSVVDFAVIKKEFDNGYFPKSIMNRYESGELVDNFIFYETRHARNQHAYNTNYMFQILIQDHYHKNLKFNTGRFIHGIVRGMPSIRVNDEVSEEFKFLPLVPPEEQENFLKTMTKEKWLDILNQQIEYHLRRDSELASFIERMRIKLGL